MTLFGQEHPLMGKRIGLLTASASRLGGGVFEAVVVQAELIRQLGGEARIFALDDAHSDADATRFAPSVVTHCAIRGPKQVGYAPDLVPALLAAELDLLHLHGIWMYPSRAGATWARQTGRPYIISPHGMLDPWITARGRWKKALARLGYERASWRAAAALHGLTMREAEDIARETGRHDSVVIANAGPLVSAGAGDARGTEVAYIGRIHAKKNLLALVAAWRDAALPDGWRLTIAGWGDEGEVARLQAVVAERDDGVSFVGPIYGADKQTLLGRARFVVLPSHSEGLPMAILESWAAGTPTLMSVECNLPAGFAAGAALDCGFDVGTIATCLRQAVAMDDAAWGKMSAAARGLAAGVFSAENVTKLWGEAYVAAIKRVAMHRGDWA
jgi:poly(glycerol-phosphate) alpha-glucosyltransferase